MSAPYSPVLRNADKLLQTKLMPPRPHAAVIPRADLLARLDAGLSKKITLITAPTGYGKTTLASLWFASRPFASAWVTLDENDNDPTRFWLYFVSALRSINSGLGKTTLSALAAPQPAPFKTFLTPLINNMARLNEPFVLALDEFHTLTSPDIALSLAFLIQNLPAALHLLLISRGEPALPLGILRARAEIMELTSTDLQFSTAETQAFLTETLPVRLPPGLVTLLQERTAGWPAGLRLAALSLQNQPAEELEKDIQAFSGGHRFVSDYLIQEVFANQPGAVQDFLLKTCFLNRLTASLCDALIETGESAAILELLERNNLFIVRLENAGDQHWYRYNPIFAEAIQVLASQRLGEASLRLLNEKASAWYEYHGLLDEAIESALAANSYDRSMLLIEKFIEIHDLSEMHTLGRWLEHIPQTQLLLHPAICFTFAQVSLYSSDRFAAASAARLEPYLQAAEATWRSQGNQARLGQLLSFRGTVAWWQADFQKALDCARQSLDVLPESDALWRGNSLLIVTQAALNAGQVLEAQDTALEARALLGSAQNTYGVLAATQLLSEIFYWQGELEQADLLSRQILAEAVGDESMLDDQGVASLNLARTSYERNELSQAGSHARHALELAESRANELLQVQACLLLANILEAENNLAEAHELLKSRLAHIHKTALIHEIQDGMALLSIRSGDIASLAGWLKALSAQAQPASLIQKETRSFIVARLHLAEGHLQEALAVLEPWEQDAAQNGRLRSQVLALGLQALGMRANPTKAALALTQALSLGQTKGYRRIFLDEGAQMAELLQATLAGPVNRSTRVYTATLLHLFPADVPGNEKTAGSILRTEPLSQQEQRVLRLLAAGLSNPDIARELVVSTNTIKTQVKSIYHKLNVSSRSQAREVARELKMLE